MASTIWDKRYSEGELACTQKEIKADPIDYTQHPFLWKHSVAKQLTGDTEANPGQIIAERYLKPAAKKLLAVGSGLAFAEEWLAKNGYVEHIVAFEASSVAVDSARERIISLGLQDRIEMRCGDVLNAGLKEGEFDAVFVQAAIHHFYNIDEMFAFFHYVLKPDGLILYDEYIGPDHHIYEPEVMDLMDEVNECLAPSYRWDVLRRITRHEVPRSTLQQMLEMDPSEGVHSSKILPLTYKYFDVVDRRDYGGTFMRPFFVGILPNFDWDNVKDQTIARLIILMENMLVRHGVIPSYHTKIVGRRKSTPADDLSPEEANRINYSNWAGFHKFGFPTKVPKVAKYREKAIICSHEISARSQAEIMLQKYLIFRASGAPLRELAPDISAEVVKLFQAQVGSLDVLRACFQISVLKTIQFGVLLTMSSLMNGHLVRGFFRRCKLRKPRS